MSGEKDNRKNIFFLEKFLTQRYLNNLQYVITISDNQNGISRKLSKIISNSTTLTIWEFNYVCDDILAQ